MMESAPAAPPPAAFSMASLKDKLKKYGRTGIAVYLGLSFCVTCGFYVAIERNFDVKKFLGIEDKPDEPPTLFERVISSKGSSFALAMLCSKAMIPLKLPVAVAITPYVHRTVQGMFRGTAAKVV